MSQEFPVNQIIVFPEPDEFFFSYVQNLPYHTVLYMSKHSVFQRMKQTDKKINKSFYSLPLGIITQCLLVVFLTLQM